MKLKIGTFTEEIGEIDSIQLSKGTDSQWRLYLTQGKQTRHFNLDKITKQRGDCEIVSEFDKTKQVGMFAEIVLGNSIEYSAMYHIVGFTEWCDEAVALAKKWLQQDMDKIIPTEYQIWVKWIIKPPAEGAEILVWGSNGSVGWKYTPENMRKKALKFDKLVKAKS